MTFTRIPTLSRYLFVLSLFTIGFSSCLNEQTIIDDLPMSIAKQEIVDKADFTFYFPKGLSEMENQQTYLNQQDEVGINKLIENNRVFEYLSVIDKYEAIDQIVKEGQHLSDLDLTPLLTTEEYNNFLKFEISNNSSSPDICLWVYYSCWYAQWPCFHNKKIKIRVNTCTGQLRASCWSYC